MFIRKQFSDIEKHLSSKDILLIIGPRQVGKTTLLKQIRDTIPWEKKWSWLTLEDPEVRERLDQHPEELFAITRTSSSDEQIVFIDETQYLKDPTNFLKYLYDMYAPHLKLIVTGSSSFYIDQKFRDSLIGRKKVFTLLPLDFGEFLHFREFQYGMDTASERQKVRSLFSEYITYGGYPEIVLIKERTEKEERLREYALDYIKKDIYESGIQEEGKYFALIRLLADQTGSLVNTNELARTLGLSQPTVEKFLFVLQKTFHIALIRPWHTNLRKELTKMPKAYFYDLGLRNAFMKDFSPLEERLDKWGYTENIFFRYLLESYKIDDIGFWRTQDKQEVDFILEDKRAIEIKFKKKWVSLSSYRFFMEKHPNLNFEIIDYEDICALWGGE
jgi:predicted AAA+ superfamily ATPase